MSVNTTEVNNTKQEQDNLDPKFKLLLSKGRSKGFVSYKEILKVMPDAEEKIEQLDSLYETLESAGIQILDEEKADEELISLTSDEGISTDDDESEKTQEVSSTASDPIRMYLREIGRIKLLLASEEVELAKMVEAQRYKRIVEELQAEGVKNPSVNEVAARLEVENIDLIEEFKKQQKAIITDGKEFIAKKAKQKLIDSNLRLVVSIAKKYMHRGLTFSDLIQEGNIGLMRAVDKFDWRRGFKFSTYATWWIRQAITRAIADQARTIRIPVHMIETIHKLRRAQRDLEQKLEREATIPELAKAMGLEESKIEEIFKISVEPSSLQNKIGPENDTQLYEFIADTDSLAPEQIASTELLKIQVDDVLNSLSDREKKVVELRFGLKDHNPRTLEDVGKVFGVTRERIRQIEAKALRKLRHPSRSKKLKDYL